MFTAGGSAVAIRATDLVGRKLFASPTEIRSDSFRTIPQDWIEVGIVENLVFPRTGGPAALVLRRGGTGPVAGQRIAVNLWAVSLPMDGNTPEDMTDKILVITAPANTLEASPAFESAPDAR